MNEAASTQIPADIRAMVRNADTVLLGQWKRNSSDPVMREACRQELQRRS